MFTLPSRYSNPKPAPLLKDRETALRWWYSLTYKQQVFYTPTGRLPQNLTGREVQIIWRNSL